MTLGQLLNAAVVTRHGHQMETPHDWKLKVSQSFQRQPVLGPSVISHSEMMTLQKNLSQKSSRGVDRSGGPSVGPSETDRGSGPTPPLGNGYLKVTGKVSELWITAPTHTHTHHPPVHFLLVDGATEQIQSTNRSKVIVFGLFWPFLLKWLKDR